MLTVTYAECHIKALYAECHYAVCRYAACRGTPGLIRQTCNLPKNQLIEQISESKQAQLTQ
jgi:hypothetical protein